MKDFCRKKIKMTFEVIVPLKTINIDNETLKKEYNNDIHKLTKFLYKMEGVWWDEEMKLIKTEFIK